MSCLRACAWLSTAPSPTILYYLRLYCIVVTRLAEMTRAEWDKIAGGILLAAGIITTLFGASLVWYEAWRHAIGEIRGPR